MAQTTLWLLDHTDRMRSLILIGNTVINALITALVTSIAISAFGNNQEVITIATAVVAVVRVCASDRSRPLVDPALTSLR